MNDGLSDTKHKHKQYLTGLLFWQQEFTRYLEKTIFLDQIQGEL